MSTISSSSPAHRPANEVDSTKDPLALIDVDHARFFVGNAKQSAFFYAHAFGFTVEEINDLTTGNRTSAQYLLTQGNIRILLETPLVAEHPAADELKRYGDGIKDIALTVFDAEKAYEQALRNGGQSAAEPRTLKDAHGTVTIASIQTYGRVVHSFVSRSGGYALPEVKKGGLFMPGFRKFGAFALNDYNREHPCGLKYFNQ